MRPLAARVAPRTFASRTALNLADPQSRLAFSWLRRRLKRGTVYVTLGRMEEKGYITSRLEAPPADSGGLPRRVYAPTSLGRRVLAAWAHIAQHFVPEFAK
jgi:DNA-binding PadR family transcriptional regulator